MPQLVGQFAVKQKGSSCPAPVDQISPSTSGNSGSSTPTNEGPTLRSPEKIGRNSVLPRKIWLKKWLSCYRDCRGTTWANVLGYISQARQHKSPSHPSADMDLGPCKQGGDLDDLQIWNGFSAFVWQIDARLRARRIIMRGRKVSAMGFVTFAVAMHVGCTAPSCPAGEHGPYDNRDRKHFPTVDQDWICVAEPEPVAPPKPPELGKLMQSAPDEPGPKDMKSVAIASIFIESCIHDLLTPEFNVNSRIEALYNSTMASGLERGIAQRLGCLGNSRSGDGCERITNCVGIAILPDEPRFAESCSQSTAMRRHVLPSGAIVNDWFSCWRLGLQCYPEPHPWCGVVTSSCSKIPAPVWCDDGRPIKCEDVPNVTNSYGYYHAPFCDQLGLTCVIDEDRAFCTGEGAACTPSLVPQGDLVADFRAGIECIDTQTLRACANGHESIVDCRKLGQGFSCIGGSRPHCGIDFQCNYDGSNAPPTCEGTLIHVCNAGVLMTFDCAELGFETCDAERGVCKPKALDAQL